MVVSIVELCETENPLSVGTLQVRHSVNLMNDFEPAELFAIHCRYRGILKVRRGSQVTESQTRSPPSRQQFKPVEKSPCSRANAFAPFLIRSRHKIRTS